MKRTIAFVTLLFLYSNLFSQETVIRNINLIDVITGKIIPKQSVLLSAGKITGIFSGSQLKLSKETNVVDGTGKYLMPGMIDSHVHFFQSGSLYTRPDELDFTKYVSYERERQQGFNNTIDYLKRYLSLGITTVADMGGPFSNFIIRDSISKTILAPNVLVTGPLFSMVADKPLELNDPPILQVLSKENVDQLFNKILPFKPDYIKVWYIADDDHPAEKSFPIVKYIGELCLKNNLKLAVHATQLKTARLAVKAGATILVHSIEDEVIPDDFIKILKDNKVTYIPALNVGLNYGKVYTGKLRPHSHDLKYANAFAYGSLTDIEGMDSTTLPSFIQRFRKKGMPPLFFQYDSILRINLKKLSGTGVNMATGTDAGNIGTFHASSYQQELETMREAGLTNAEIIKASTINAAMAFGIEKQIGSIEKGKGADLLILKRNPLESIDNLNSIEWVFKNGNIAKADTIVSESSEAIVQRQLNAYNARNIDLFIATYSDDCELISSKGKLIAKGHQQLRQEYEVFFKNVPNLYCQIEQRMMINNKVIDKEKVRVGKEIIYGVAVYEVEKQKIKKVTFIE